MDIIRLNRKPILEFDAGHGGSDRSNRGAKWIEADGTLLIDKRVASFLPKDKFIINFTRTTDTTISLTNRVNKAVRDGADLLISHHTNSGGGRGGSEVFYSVDIPNDRQYAVALSQGISSALGIIDRGAKTRESEKFPGEDYYTVIDGAQDNGVKHVFIAEYAFHDISTDEAKLLNNTLLDKACKAEAKVICEMFGIPFIAPIVAPVVAPVVKAPVYGTVTASSLNVRSAMVVMDNNKIGLLMKGQKVKIDKRYGDWYSIYFGDHGGYISANYVKLV